MKELGEFNVLVAYKITNQDSIPEEELVQAIRELNLEFYAFNFVESMNATHSAVSLFETKHQLIDIVNERLRVLNYQPYGQIKALLGTVALIQFDDGTIHFDPEEIEQSELQGFQDIILESLQDKFEMGIYTVNVLLFQINLWKEEEPVVNFLEDTFANPFNNPFINDYHLSIDGLDQLSQGFFVLPQFQIRKLLEAARNDLNTYIPKRQITDELVVDYCFLAYCQTIIESTDKIKDDINKTEDKKSAKGMNKMVDNDLSFIKDHIKQILQKYQIDGIMLKTPNIYFGKDNDNPN